jgi:Fe-Mn family superoxide dismutase
MPNTKTFLKKTFSQEADQKSYPFILPDMPYDQNALEPYISSETLDYHHTKHHKTYVNNLNTLLEQNQLQSNSLEEIIHKSRDLDLDAIFNNAAQVWNHTFYWHCMKPEGGGKPQEALLEKICQDFESFENFIAQFRQAGAAQFGSGWVWLVSQDGILKICKTANAQTPIVNGLYPILTCDVWEHAYYIDYRNKRMNYLEIFTEKLINWDFANKNFASSL